MVHDKKITLYTYYMGRDSYNYMYRHKYLKLLYQWPWKRILYYYVCRAYRLNVDTIWYYYYFVVVMRWSSIVLLLLLHSVYYNIIIITRTQYKVCIILLHCTGPRAATRLLLYGFWLYIISLRTYIVGTGNPV